MPDTKICTICLDSEFETHLFFPGCDKHGICHNCLVEQVKAATKSEDLYPLKCPGGEQLRISNEIIFRILGAGDADLEEILDRFYEKIEEYKCHAAARTYCTNKQCHLVLGYSRFLDAGVWGDDTAVLCPDCREVTCRLCKTLRLAGQAHVCQGDDLDKNIVAYIKSLPEEDHWLWRKCFRCRSWVNKSDACNHMTCRCGGQFCLCCGREWVGLTSCKWGCPHYEKPMYDAEGFNQNGYNPDTGLNRDGLPWDPNHEHEDADDDQDNLGPPVYGEDGFDQYGWNVGGLDREGFDRDGFDAEGYSRNGRDEFGWDREGFNWDGFDINGRDREGYDEDGFRDGFDRDGFGPDGFNASGYDHNGFDRTGRDPEGYFEDGADLDGFDREGTSLRNMPRQWYDEDGFDPFGEDVWGFSRAGYDFEGFDPHGYDIHGFDLDGFNDTGYDKEGFNRLGFNQYRLDREGLLFDGYNQHHRTPAGELDPRYHIGPYGNVRRIVDEGPSDEVIDCGHLMQFVRSSAICEICHWRSDIFHHQCQRCGVVSCRACDRRPMFVREELRSRFLWPGTESYGIDWMFEREETSATVKEAGRQQAESSRQSTSLSSRCGNWADVLEKPKQA